MLKVYLSGPSSEHKRAAALEQRVWDDAGGDVPTIRFDDRWWLDAPSFTGRDHLHAPEERRRITRMHFNNVQAADCFWLLAPSKGHHSCMAWAELGWAQAMGRALPIVVSGEFATASVCTSLSDRVFLTDDEALAYVLDLARKS